MKHLPNVSMEKGTVPPSQSPSAASVPLDTVSEGVRQGLPESGGIRPCVCRGSLKKDPPKKEEAGQNSFSKGNCSSPFPALVPGEVFWPFGPLPRAGCCSMGADLPNIPMSPGHL